MRDELHESLKDSKGDKDLFRRVQVSPELCPTISMGPTYPQGGTVGKFCYASIDYALTF